MSAFRAKAPRAGWVLGLAFLLTAGGAGVAVAQDGPRPILPRGYGDPEAEETQPAPSKAPQQLPQPGGADAPVEIPARPGTRGAGVEVGVLASPDTTLLGLIGSETPEALGRTLWAGTASATAARLLTGMPAASRSPTVSGLVRRLLLTRAMAPEGDPGTFTLARFQALFRGGRLDETVRMGAALGDPAKAQPIAGIVSGAALYAGDRTEACRYRDPAPDGSETPFALKLRAICEIETGRRHAARLIGEVMQETGIEAPLFYAALAGAIFPGEAAPAALATEAPGPAEWSLLALTENRPEPDRLTTYSPPLLAAIAQTGPGPTQEATVLALGATELAATFGALDATSAREQADRLLEAGPLDGDILAELDPALRVAVDGARAVRDAQTPALSLEAIYTALNAAPDGAAFVRTAHFFAEDIRAIVPDDSQVWAAPTLARAALAVEDSTRASAWVQLFESVPFVAGEAKAHAAELRALRALLFVARGEATPVWRFAEAEAWFASADRGEAARERVALELKILETLGYQMRPDLRASTRAAAPLRTGYAAPERTLTALERASAAGRRGETVALAATALGARSASAVSDATLLAAIRALDGIGLERDARALAFEALVHDGEL